MTRTDETAKARRHKGTEARRRSDEATEGRRKGKCLKGAMRNAADPGLSGVGRGGLVFRIGGLTAKPPVEVQPSLFTHTFS